MNKQAIENEALKLPELARAALAEKLLASLDGASALEIQELWLDEAESRAAEIDSGAVELVSSQDAAKGIREMFG